MTALAAKPAVQDIVESRYRLPANMEMANLGAVHADLVALLKIPSDVFVLDGGDISVIDTAGIQLLVNFVRTVTAAGSRLHWENYSIQVWQLANELGLDSQLGD